MIENKDNPRQSLERRDVRPTHQLRAIMA